MSAREPPPVAESPEKQGLWPAEVMDIHQFEIFRAVLSTRNMTRAASLLFLTPAAVSLQIRNLAEELGADLFTKSGRDLVPTPAALQLAKSADQLARVMQQIRHDFDTDPDRDTRPLVVATGITPLVYKLGGPLQSFRREHPHARIVVQVCSTRETIPALQNRQADVGIVVLPVDAPGIVSDPLYDEQLRLCVARADRSFPSRRVAAGRLRGRNWILYSRASSSTRAILDGFFSRVGLEPEVSMEMEDTEAIKKLVELGFGISILPEHALANSSQGLRALEIEGHPLVRRIALATAETAYPRRLTTLFCSYIQRTVGAVN